MNSLKQRGDTIVEVLIAVAVVGAVLSGAYVSANRSLNTNRRAQERSVATKLTESQLESLKVAAKDPAKGLFSKTTFCVNISTPALNLVDITNINNLSSYPIECQSNNGVIYYPSIELDNSTNVFTARTRWNRLGGGVDEVTIVYRLYE